jgi:hypothetical protein
MSLKSSLCNRVVSLRNSVLFLPVFVAILSTSCIKETSLIGLGLVPPGDKIYTFYTDTITVYSSILKSDSIATYGIFDFLFGSYNDPVFGISSSNVFTQFSYGYAGFRYGPNPKADSVILHIKYKYQYIYGNKNATVNFKVYSLNNPGQPRWDTVHYYSSRTAELKTYIHNQIGQFSFCPALHKTDSIIRIALDPAFGNGLIQNTDTFVYDSADLFHSNINCGIAIIPDNAVSPGDGYIFKTYYNADYFWIDVYYRDDNRTTDSVSHFGISTANFDARINTYTHDYSTSKFLSSLITPTIHDTLGYISSMAGIMTKLSFPGLDALKTKPSDIISINSAELIFPVYGDDTTQNPPSEMIQLLHLDNNGAYAITPDYSYFNASNAYIDGNYDRYNRQYITQITKHIEYCLTHKNYGKDLYVIANTSSSSAYPEFTFAGRSILKNGTGKNKIKLKVIYTKR